MYVVWVWDGPALTFNEAKYTNANEVHVWRKVTFQSALTCIWPQPWDVFYSWPHKVEVNHWKLLKTRGHHPLNSGLHFLLPSYDFHTQERSQDITGFGSRLDLFTFRKIVEWGKESIRMLLVFQVWCSILRTRNVNFHMAVEINWMISNPYMVGQKCYLGFQLPLLDGCLGVQVRINYFWSTALMHWLFQGGLVNCKAKQPIKNHTLPRIATVKQSTMPQ